MWGDRAGWPGRRGALGLVLAAALGGPLGSLRAAWAQLPPGAAPVGLPPERVVRVKVPPAQADEGLPFQMGFELTHGLAEDGLLAHPGQSARSLGLRFVFREGRSIRQHFAIAHQWERSGGVLRQGFRFDLLALGFPIAVADGFIRIELEPILRPVRGQIMFEDAGLGQTRSLLRFESGFAFGLRFALRDWFLTLEPLSIDFRTVVATRDETRTGFSRIWSIATTLGRDF